MQVQYVPPISLHSVWHTVLPMLQECLEHDSSNAWVMDIYAMLRYGHATLHVGLDGGEIKSMLIGQVQADPWDGEQTYVVLYAHAVNQYEPHESEVEKLAKSMNCTKISFISPRLGWVKRAKEKGYELAHVRFHKRLS